MTIIAKNIPVSMAYGNSVIITYTGIDTLIPDTSTTKYNADWLVGDITINRVIEVINLSNSNVIAPDGESYPQGTWDMTLYGGSPIVPPLLGKAPIVSNPSLPSDAGVVLVGGDQCFITVVGFVNSPVSTAVPLLLFDDEDELFDDEFELVWS